MSQKQTAARHLHWRSKTRAQEMPGQAANRAGILQPVLTGGYFDNVLGPRQPIYCAAQTFTGLGICPIGFAAPTGTPTFHLQRAVPAEDTPL